MPRKVYVAIPCVKGFLPVQTVHSLTSTQAVVARSEKVEIYIQYFTGSLPHVARNLAVHDFLKTDCDVIFWIDDDMQWEAMDFARLLVHSQNYPCVVGVYPARREPPRYYINMIENEKPNKDGLLEINGTGLGFACVRREVIEHLADKAKELLFAGSPMKSIFRCDERDGESRGEDYAFWDDVRAEGWKVYADTQVSIGHVGQKVYQMKPPV